MSFKAKTVLNKDIRIFKQDIDTMDNAFEAVMNFIKEKYEIKGAFSIQYEDEEKDLITISSSDDLEEAYKQAEANGVVLKLVVIPDEKNAPVYSFTSEVDRSELNEANGNGKNEEKNNESSGSSEEEEEKEECAGKKLLNDLINNKEFREEFIHFIVSFINTLKENMNKVSNEAFQQSLLNHQQVNNHPAMQKVAEMFPVLLAQFEPFLSLIFNIDVENITSWVNQIIEMSGGDYGNGFNPFGNLQPLMQMFGFNMPPPPHHHGFTPFGPPPFFGYGFSQGHGPHHAAPPPPCHGFFGHHGPHGPHGGHFHRHHSPQGFGYGGPFCGGKFHHGKHGGKKCHFENSGNCENMKNEEIQNNPSFCKWQKYRCSSRGNKDPELSVAIIKDDVTLPDKAYVLPGQVIVKTWSVKNDGKKDWPNGMKIKYHGKAFNPIVNGVEYDVPSLKINEEGDVSIMIETPKTEDNIFGKQKSNWKLYLPNGKGFGPLFHVRVYIVKEDEEQVQVVKEEDEVQVIEPQEEKKEEEPLVSIIQDIPVQQSDLKTDLKTDKKMEKLLKAKDKLEKKVAKLDAKIAKKEDQENVVVINSENEMVQEQSSSFDEVEPPPVIEEFEMDMKINLLCKVILMKVLMYHIHMKNN